MIKFLMSRYLNHIKFVDGDKTLCGRQTHGKPRPGRPVCWECSQASVEDSNTLAAEAAMMWLRLDKS